MDTKDEASFRVWPFVAMIFAIALGNFLNWRLTYILIFAAVAALITALGVWYVMRKKQ